MILSQNSGIDVLEKLKAIGQTFLTNDFNKESEFEIVNDYLILMTEISGLDLLSREMNNGINLSNGEAIGTAAAARCITDGFRTRMFVRGIVDAVNSLLVKGKKPVHIFYAGTGPFATLLLPILANFSPEQLRCTLLEINPMSFQYLKKIFATLNFDQYVEAYIQDDATTHQLTQPDTVDILLSETMQNGLRGETQVPIVLNLVPQLKADVVMIPEKITVDAALTKFTAYIQRKETTPERDYLHKLGVLLSLDVPFIRYADEHFKNQDGTWTFPIVRYSGEQVTMINYHTLTLNTEIKTFGNNQLTHGDSELSFAWPLLELTEVKGNRNFSIQYRIGDNPGFHVEYDEVAAEEVVFYTESLRLDLGHRQWE